MCNSENQFDQLEAGLTHPISLDEQQIKECQDRQQSLLPLPDFCRRIEGDSDHRVQSE